jgi:hypothetical protein
MVVVVVDEGGDGGFQFPFEEVVFEQDAVFQGLMICATVTDRRVPSRSELCGLERAVDLTGQSSPLYA